MELVNAVELEIAVLLGTVLPLWIAVEQEQVTAEVWEEVEIASAIAASVRGAAVAVASEGVREASAVRAHVQAAVAAHPAWVVLAEVAAEAEAEALEEVAVAAVEVAVAVAGGGSEL